MARSLRDLDLPLPLLVEAARAAIAANEPSSARARARELESQLLRPVINATGVLLHTNLGRAPLAYVQSRASSNLELDLASGRRGSRRTHVEPLLARLTGAEAALVVNNGAAAVLLVLAAHAHGRPVLVSRGELVEIGGGFRIPEILSLSGADLVEVGTTNRTRVTDYADWLAAHGDDALILKVHQSNYRIVGFEEQVDVEDLARLGPPVVVDLGSGLLDAKTPWLKGQPPRWLANEPAARQCLEHGAAIVTFSGDKLLGGPQAGVIAGRRDLIAPCASHPLARAFRPGSLVLGALQQVALCYLRRDVSEIPFWQMATTTPRALRARAEAVMAQCGVSGTVVRSCRSVVGGGSVPGHDLESFGLAIPGDHSGTLRARRVPVISRVEAGMTICDLRSVHPDDDGELCVAISSLCEQAP